MKDYIIPPALPEKIIRWFHENKRDLPWRQDHDPYHVWLSEIMLQQTRIQTVIPYYLRFIEAFPTVQALADTEEDRVLKLWEGLGYYSRARNLHRAAKEVARQYGCEFPKSYTELKKLPGVGDYTAAAVASICYDEPVPAVDGNIIRVMARVCAMKDEDIHSPQSRKKLKEMLKTVYPETHSGDFSQGLMELGEVICLPNGTPLCSDCPASSLCAASQMAETANIPAPKKKQERKKQDITVFILRDGNTLALNRRGPGLLHGMWEFPNIEGHLSETAALLQVNHWGLIPTAVTGIMQKKHIFTHIEWAILVYHIEAGVKNDLFHWVPEAVLQEQYSLPTAFKKCL